MLFDLSFPQEVTSGAVSKNLIISRMPYSRATSKPIGRLLMLGNVRSVAQILSHKSSSAGNDDGDIRSTLYFVEKDRTFSCHSGVLVIR